MILNDGSANIFVLLENSGSAISLKFSYRLTPATGYTFTIASVQVVSSTRASVYFYALYGTVYWQNYQEYSNASATPEYYGVRSPSNASGYSWKFPYVYGSTNELIFCL